MSLIQTATSEARPEWLASESSRRLKTATAYRSLGVKDESDNTVWVKSGTVYPANDSTAEGIVYRDVDVTMGDYPCSVMKAGFVYENRLPETLTEDAKTALEAMGIHFETAPEFERTY